MKYKLLSACVLAGVAMASQQAFAADGTINFTGQIQATTCAINGGTSGANNFTIALPSALSTQLDAAGKVAGRTSFQIALTGCPSTATSVHTFYEAGATTDASTGRLNNMTSGGAANVQIQLLNSDASVIKAGFSDSLQNSKSVALSSNAATLTYYAEYYATGATTAGAVTSSVAYTIVYN